MLLTVSRTAAVSRTADQDTCVRGNIASHLSVRAGLRPPAVLMHTAPLPRTPTFASTFSMLPCGLWRSTPAARSERIIIGRWVPTSYDNGLIVHGARGISHLTFRPLCEEVYEARLVPGGGHGR